MANSNDYAFVVGIDDYPNFNSLKGARKDATAFKEWITTIAGVSNANCVEILSSIDPAPPKPTQYDIDPKLNDLMDMARAAQLTGQEPNRLYFYFSGHGLGLDSTDVGLCLPFWSRSFKGDNLSINSYLEALKKSGLFKEIIVFLDCCRVRDTNVVGRPPFMTTLPPAANAPQVKSIIFYASEYLSPSFENRAGEEVRGFFTTALLDGLNGQAAVANGQITYNSLLNYLMREVPLRSKQRQKPRWINELLPQQLNAALFKTDTSPVTYSYVDPFVRLDIFLPQSDPNFQSVTVYNGFNAVMGQSFQPEPVKLSLLTGKYFVVSEFTDSCITEEIDLTVDTQHYVGLKSFMVAPNDHEYQCIPAQMASQHPTKALGDNPNAGLLIFIRYQERDLVDPTVNMNAYLELRNEKSELITCFEEEDLFHENNDKTLYRKNGYLNYSIHAPAGLYYLVYSDEPKRQMPLYLFEGRQTQLFMLFVKLSPESAKWLPAFETARIYLSRLSDGFQAYSPSDSVENKIDAATRFLQNAHGNVPVGLLDDLFYGKFQEPMRGLLAAYILLKGKLENADFYDDFFVKEHPEMLNRKEEYFRIVISNLNHLLGPDSPDVKAIKLLTTDFMDDYKNEPLHFIQPPMISFGLREVIRRASTKPTLLAAGSLLIQIAPKIKTDSVFSSWEALVSFLPKSPAYESTKGIEGKDLDPSVVNSIYQLTIEGYKQNPQESLKRGFDKQVAQALALPVQTVREYMTAMTRETEISKDQQEYFRLDATDLENVNKTVTQFSALLQVPKLSDITGMKFQEQTDLKMVGILTLENLVQLETDENQFNAVTTEINVTAGTLTNWIDQAKKLVE